MANVIRTKVWKITSEQMLIDKFNNVATAIAPNNVGKVLKVVIMRLDQADIAAEEARIDAEKALKVSEQENAPNLAVQIAALDSEKADYTAVK